MPNGLYLDSSALVKLYVREPETTDLAAFVRRHAPPIPYSALHELELTRALLHRQDGQGLTAAAAARIKAAIDDHLAMGALARPEADWPAAFAEAIRLLSRHRGLRSLDALHIALALKLGSKLFVTFDRRQASAAREEGLRIWPRA